ncbi:MAG: hypothetical protein D6800_00610 [Candidatus Zixiibacteriota bacterium]|nr:MAG: hypothetical protein D6800_00610 [candidate division Zixibacteria bacterium]
MLARVLEIDERQIYLEVEDQLRFKVPYRHVTEAALPSVSDKVEFHLRNLSDQTVAVIERVSKRGR